MGAHLDQRATELDAAGVIDLARLLAQEGVMQRLLLHRADRLGIGCEHRLRRPPVERLMRRRVVAVPEPDGEGVVEGLQRARRGKR